MDRFMPPVPSAVAARVSGALPDAPLRNVELSRLDCIQLGAMFSTDGIPGYGASYLRVVYESKLYTVVSRLLEDDVFRAALKVPEGFSLDALPLMAGDVEGELYVCNVPADVVWAAILFITQTWGKQHGITIRASVANQSQAEFCEMLGRLNFSRADVDRIMAARAEHAESVDAVFDALVHQSALLAAAVEQDRTRPPPASVPSDAAPPDPDAAGPSGSADQPGPPPQIPPSRQASNDKIAQEVCDALAERLQGTWGEQGITDLSANVCRALADFTSKGISISEMTGYTQANVFNTSVALAVVFAYTIFGSFENNEYARRVVDALAMREAPTGAAPAPEQE